MSRSLVGSWHVSWDGKRTVLPADDRTNDHSRRCYFLLPPGATIPPVITLTYEPPPPSSSPAADTEIAKQGTDSIQINPLPAIFAPELGATARTAGKKGVLHTIWAKKRLQVLAGEIKQESKNNLEGVALEMALQEKDWIEANFGVVGRPAAIQTTGLGGSNPAPLSPTTPLSPTGGRRLTDKLKGLKLQTSEMDLARRAGTNTSSTSAITDAELHPLSPDEPDVAISSFTSFHIPARTPSNPTRPTNNTTTASIASTIKPVSHHPPSSIQSQQQAQAFASLSMQPLPTPSASNYSSPQSVVPDPTNNHDAADDLFAKALSPRSPDIPRSPFSFSPEETKIPLAKELHG